MKLTYYIFLSPLQQNDDELVEFYLYLCHDVILEVLQFGDRRPLVKMERIGRRFHWMIEKFFLNVPFHRLDLKLVPATGYFFFFPHNYNLANKLYIYLIVCTTTNARRKQIGVKKFVCNFLYFTFSQRIFFYDKFSLSNSPAIGLGHAVYPSARNSAFSFCQKVSLYFLF